MGMNKDGAVFYTTENGEVAVFYPRGDRRLQIPMKNQQTIKQLILKK